MSLPKLTAEQGLGPAQANYITRVSPVENLLQIKSQEKTSCGCRSKASCSCNSQRLSNAVTAKNTH